MGIDCNIAEFIFEERELVRWILGEELGEEVEKERSLA